MSQLLWLEEPLRSSYSHWPHQSRLIRSHNRPTVSCVGVVCALLQAEVPPFNAADSSQHWGLGALKVRESGALQSLQYAAGLWLLCGEERVTLTTSFFRSFFKRFSLFLKTQTGWRCVCFLKQWVLILLRFSLLVSSTLVVTSRIPWTSILENVTKTYWVILLDLWLIKAAYGLQRLRRNQFWPEKPHRKRGWRWCQGRASLQLRPK